MKRTATSRQHLGLAVVKRDPSNGDPMWDDEDWGAFMDERSTSVAEGPAASAGSG